MRLYNNDEYREEFMALVYGLLMSDGTNDRANQIIGAFDSAPEVEAEPVPPNDPLTLEELREMAMEQSPVWCIDADGLAAGLLCVQPDLDFSDRTPHIWMQDEDACIGCYPIHHMLRFGAKFYRRKPEEVTM